MKWSPNEPPGNADSISRDVPGITGRECLRASFGHVMKIATKTVFLFMVGFTLLARGQDVYIEGAEGKWYSATELERIARDYAKQRKIDFKFDRTTERNVWVSTCGSNIIATVSFSSGIGKPLLTVDVDRTGKVVTSHLSVAYCGRSSGPGYVDFDRTNRPQ